MGGMGQIMGRRDASPTLLGICEAEELIAGEGGEEDLAQAV